MTKVALKSLPWESAFEATEPCPVVRSGRYYATLAQDVGQAVISSSSEGAPLVASRRPPEQPLNIWELPSAASEGEAGPVTDSYVVSLYTKSSGIVRTRIKLTQEIPRPFRRMRIKEDDDCADLWVVAGDLSRQMIETHVDLINTLYDEIPEALKGQRWQGLAVNGRVKTSHQCAGQNRPLTPFLIY